MITETHTNQELREMGILDPCPHDRMISESYFRECPDCEFYEELPEIRTYPAC